MHSAAAGLRVQAAVDPSCDYFSAVGFDLYGFDVARNVDCNLRRKFARAAVLPFAHYPRGIATCVCADLVLLELTPRAILRPLIRFIANDVVDTLDLPTLNLDRPDLHLDVKIVNSG